MVIPRMSKWKYKQYNPQNIKESHEKVKFVCGATCYCYNVVAYIDIKTSYTVSYLAFCGQSKEIIEHLIKPLHKNHHTFS